MTDLLLPPGMLMLRANASALEGQLPAALGGWLGDFLNLSGHEDRPLTVIEAKGLLLADAPYDNPTSAEVLKEAVALLLADKEMDEKFRAYRAHYPEARLEVEAYYRLQENTLRQMPGEDVDALVEACAEAGIILIEGDGKPAAFPSTTPLN